MPRRYGPAPPMPPCPIVSLAYAAPPPRPAAMPHPYRFHAAPPCVDLAAAAGRLRAALGRAVRECPRGSILALSGGLDSSIIAHIAGAAGAGPSSAVAVVARDFVAADTTYCQMAAASSGLPLRIVEAGTDELLDAAAGAVKALRTFNDIEVRNSAASYVAAKAALEAPGGGEPCLVTGDGADELFAGYSFLLAKEPGELPGELARMRRIMRFASHEIGRSLGVRVASPFLDGEVAGIAADAGPDLLVGRSPGGGMCGKWVLRRAFEDALPPAIAWRRKVPIQDGSGTAGLPGMFDAIVSDAEFERRRAEAAESDGVRIRTKESMHYYSVYRRMHGRPPRAAGPAPACPYCGCEVLEDDRYCRMCGAHPV